MDDPLEASPVAPGGLRMHDRGDRAGNSGEGGGGLRLRSSPLPVGDVLLSSLSSSDLHARLRSEQLACLLLPDRQIGHQDAAASSQQLGSRASVGYLPPCEFTGSSSFGPGTLIGFSLLSLQRRLAVISGDAGACERPHPALLRARTISLETPREQFLVAAVLDVLRLIEASVDVTAEPPPAALALDDLLLRSIGLLLAPQPPPPPPGGSSLERAVEQAMDWMRSQLRRPISLVDLEQRVGYGRRSLQCGFQRRVGCGPMQWLRRQRLETAHGLIRALASSTSEQRLSLQEVARECGYGSLSSFSRDFSSLYGYPPSRLLRNRS